MTGKAKAFLSQEQEGVMVDKMGIKKILSEFGEFYAEFKSESDRAAVILGTAKLDLLLYQLLAKFMVPNVGSEDELFDGDAPLSTFHAKIQMAYRLGLIDRNFVRALHLIRKIRNSFAHETTGCNLSSGAHRNRVKELRLVFKYEIKFEEAKNLFFKDQPESSGDFRTALALVEIRLEGTIKHVLPLDPSDACELIPEAFYEAKGKNEAE